MIRVENWDGAKGFWPSPKIKHVLFFPLDDNSTCEMRLTGTSRKELIKVFESTIITLKKTL